MQIISIFLIKKILSEDSLEKVTKNTVVLANVANLAHQNIPYSNQRFLHTKFSVEKMIERVITRERESNRMKKKSKRIREEEPKYTKIAEV